MGMGEWMNIYGMNLQEAPQVLPQSTITLWPAGDGQNRNTREKPSRFKSPMHALLVSRSVSTHGNEGPTVLLIQSTSQLAKQYHAHISSSLDEDSSNT